MNVASELILLHKNQAVHQPGSCLFKVFVCRIHLDRRRFFGSFASPNYINLEIFVQKIVRQSRSERR